MEHNLNEVWDILQEVKINLENHLRSHEKHENRLFALVCILLTFLGAMIVAYFKTKLGG